jgi:hypothetical protein
MVSAVLCEKRGELGTHLKLSALTFALILSATSVSSLSQQTLPDLLVTKIWIGDKNNTPIAPRAGEALYVCATVKNVGNAAAEGFYVQPYFGGSPLAAGGPGKLEGGGAQDWASGPVVVGPGIYEVRWVLNPDRKIAEANYGNNEISMIVVIEAGSPSEALLQPVGGLVGLAVIALIVLAVGLISRRYLLGRRKNQPDKQDTPKK